MSTLRWMTGFDHVHIQRTGRAEDVCWAHVFAWNARDPGETPQYIVIERESGKTRVMRVFQDFPGGAAAALSDLRVCWEQGKPA